MAISQNFLTGRMRKSAGGTRFSTWRGLNIVAAKPISVRQNVTPAVQLNRDKMSVVGRFVSKMNILVKPFYSLGISKTTPFADTVKFFRTSISDQLKLSIAAVAGRKFGTGNTEGNTYVNVAHSISGFSVHASIEDPAFGHDELERTLIVFNEEMTKVGYVVSVDITPSIIEFVPDDYGFIVGDRVAFAVKDIQFRPGNDLSGKVKMQEDTSFIILTS
jgi:hypothetical protein